MRLRQLVLAAAELDPLADKVRDIFGIEGGYPDPGVEFFGLQNMVLPIGDTFLEIVSPIQENTAAGRYRDRRGGDCGYMVMVQSDDYRRDRDRVEALGVRIVWSAELDDISGMHLHPRDTGGPLLSLDQPIPAESWRWAGPDWQDHSHTANARALIVAEIADPEPEQRARRWAEVLDQECRRSDTGWEIQLEPGTLRFAACEAASDAGLVGIDLSLRDPATAAERAEAHGALVAPTTVELAGVRFHLREAHNP